MFFLLRNQQKAKQKRNNSITDLAEARVEYSKQTARISTLDSEIDALEDMIVNITKENKQINEKIQSENEFLEKMNNESKEQSKLFIINS